MPRIIEQKYFSLHQVDYIARKYKGQKRDIIYKESGELVENMKGIAREFLKQFNQDVPTDANIMNTYKAIDLLMSYC